MELKAFKETLFSGDGQISARAELAVETEIPVPDYLPAVFKIVKCIITPVLLQNDVNTNRWQGEGYLRCTVYYQSDEEGSCLCRTEQKYPFEKAVDLPAGNYLPGPAFLCGETEYVNCRAVSEHRIDVRGAYTLRVMAFKFAEQEVLTSLADCGMEQRRQLLHGTRKVAAIETIATNEISVPLPAAGETILEIAGQFVDEKAGFTAGGKMAYEATLQVQICFRSAGTSELSCRSEKLSVQQAVDLPGLQETDELTAWGQVLNCTLATVDGGEGNAMLRVSWKLYASAWRTIELAAVTDAYSTVCQVATEPIQIRLPQRCTWSAEPVPLVFSDDIPGQTGEVLGCFITLEEALPQAGKTADTVVLAGKGCAHVICSDEHGELNCLDHSFSWQTQQEWQGTPDRYCTEILAETGKIACTKSGTKLSVSTEILLRGTLLRLQEHTLLQDVTLGEMFPNKADGPALYLCAAQEGESLFEIAKHYHARAKDIAEANHLSAAVEDAPDMPPQEYQTPAGYLLVPTAL